MTQSGAKTVSGISFSRRATSLRKAPRLAATTSVLPATISTPSPFCAPASPARSITLSAPKAFNSDDDNSSPSLIQASAVAPYRFANSCNSSSVLRDIDAPPLTAIPLMSPPDEITDAYGANIVSARAAERSCNSMDGIRRSGLSEPNRRITSAKVNRGNGVCSSTPIKRKMRTNNPSTRAYTWSGEAKLSSTSS